jgi:hypothetical protein
MDFDSISDQVAVEVLLKSRYEKFVAQKGEVEEEVLLELQLKVLEEEVEVLRVNLE